MDGMNPPAEERPKRPAKLLLGCAGLMAVLFLGGLLLLAYWLSPAHLVTMLNDGTPSTKRWAADTLIGKGADSAGAAVLEAASNPALDPEARRMAVFILGEMHHTAAEPRLIALMKEGDAVLGGQAAFALGRMGDGAMLNELLGAYDGAPKGLKLRILAALGELGNAGAADLINREAARADDDLIRDTAHQAAIKMKEKHPGGGRQ